MVCQECKEEVDELIRVRVGRRTRKLCEQCAELAREEAEIAGEAEGVVRGMMEYKGR
jgi:protein-arginine kinase activator protein McsA